MQDYLVLSCGVNSFVDSMKTLVFRRLAECECHTLPVLQDGRLQGLLTMDNLGEYLLIQAAIKENDTRDKSRKDTLGYSAAGKF